MQHFLRNAFILLLLSAHSIIAYGQVGIGTVTPISKLHIADGNILVSGTYGTGRSIEASGAGLRMFFDAKKGAFRAGEVINDRWDSANVGRYSFAGGFETLCSGDYSVAFGTNNIASGSFATCFGISNTASGQSSTAIGRGSTAASYGEICLGLYGTTYTPAGTTSFNSADRLLNIGKGASGSSRSDAFTVLKSGNTGIGTASPASTLEVNGSLGLKVKTGQAAGTNDPDATAAIWIYASGTGTITLPGAGGCSNRSYTIINSTGGSRAISSYKDLTGTTQTSIGNGTSLWLISDGSNWYQIK